MIKHYTVTLNGSVQRLSDYLTTPAVIHGQDVLVNNLVLQPGGANAAPVYVGGHGAITSDDHLFSLPAGAAGVPPAPFMWELAGRQVRPSDIYVLGTNTEKLRFGFAE
jgi:hypothetical protein